MAKTIDFANAVKERKEKIENLRQMCLELQKMEEENPDYDPTESIQDAILEIDPEIASLIDEDAVLYPQAVAGRLRAAECDVPGTDFEKRRDRAAINKEAAVKQKLKKKMG